MGYVRTARAAQKKEKKMAHISYERMVEAIEEGGSVLWDGQVVNSLEGLPKPEDLTSDTETQDAIRAELEARVQGDLARLALLNAKTEPAADAKAQAKADAKAKADTQKPPENIELEQQLAGKSDEEKAQIIKAAEEKAADDAAKAAGK